MKKSISKLSKIFFTIIMAAMFLVLDAQAVNAEASSIKLAKATALDGYVAGIKFYIKKQTNGTYVYCLDKHKYKASNVTAKLSGTMNAGVAYILENGYPNKHFTGDSKKDYYITQLAVWWYLDDTTGSSNLPSSVKTGSDKYGLRKYVKKLVSGAKTAKNKGYSSPSLNAKVSSTKMSLSDDSKYYVSKPIDANAKNVTGGYNVSIVSAPTGTIITGVGGAKKKSFGANDKFLIKIPVSSVGEGKTVNAKVKITASSKIQKAYKYVPTNGSVQPVVRLYPVTKNVSDTIKVTATRPKTKKPPKKTIPPVTIKKVDKSTGKTISGATLVIKNASGNVVKTFTSSTSGNKFTDLAAGSYTVVETQAPAGYELNSEPVSFQVVENGSDVSVTVENEHKKTGVVINKVDATTGNNIAGATLVVKDANGNVIETFTSTVNGYEINGLTNGTYTVTETQAPAGYKLNSEPVTFTISDDNPTVDVTVENQPESSVVTIAKVDSVTGKMIAGAEILVTNEAGEEVARFTSTTSAYTLKDLEYGTYTIEEVSAPDGYFLTEETQTFVVDANHLTAQITIKNVPKTCDNGGKDDDECSVDVPNTGSSSTLFYLLGIVIVSSGVLYVYKDNEKAR